MRITPIDKIKSLIEWTQTKLNKKQFIIFSSILVGLANPTQKKKKF